MPYTIDDAKARAEREMPYLRPLIRRMNPVKKCGLGTFATDEYARLCFDPAVLETKFSLDECAAVVLHEALHVLCDQLTEMQCLVDRDAGPEALMRYNCASDLCVNSMLTNTELPLTADFLLPADYGLEAHLTASEYNEQLVTHEEFQQGFPQLDLRAVAEEFDIGDPESSGVAGLDPKRQYSLRTRIFEEISREPRDMPPGLLCYATLI